MVKHPVKMFLVVSRILTFATSAEWSQRSPVARGRGSGSARSRNGFRYRTRRIQTAAGAVAAKEVVRIVNVASRLLREAAERRPGRPGLHHAAESPIHKQGVVYGARGGGELADGDAGPGG
jgi:hypothetical protein